MKVTCATTPTTVMLVGHLVRRTNDEGTYGIWGNLAVPLPSTASSIPDGAMVCVQAYWVSEQQRWGMISILQVAKEGTVMVDDSADEAACAAQAQLSSPSVFAPADRAASLGEGSDEDGLSFVTSAVHPEAHATMKAEDASKAGKPAGSRFTAGDGKRFASEITDATSLPHVVNEAQPQIQSQPSVAEQSGRFAFNGKVATPATARPDVATAQAHTKASTSATNAQPGTRFGAGKKRLDELRAGEQQAVRQEEMPSSAMSKPAVVASIGESSSNDIPSVDMFEDQFDDIPF